VLAACGWFVAGRDFDARQRFRGGGPFETWTAATDYRLGIRHAFFGIISKHVDILTVAKPIITSSTRNLIDSYQSKTRQLGGKEIKNLEYQSPRLSRPWKF
jgi:hypothetical protein